MNAVMSLTRERVVKAPADYNELVRGNEDRLVAMVSPAVRESSVVLDLGTVRRIDAAGIAALISMYGSARDAGHTFRLDHVTGHVAEILKLVGLDHILVAQDEAQVAPLERCVECPAA